METRKLGRTNLDVSALCLGTMTWGRQNTEAEGHAQMDYALERGINFFDTAELYAVPINAETQGRTEEIIGSWFSKSKNRNKVILATKVTGPALPWIRGGKSKLDRANITAAVETSLQRLQTDYIDLYQLHWPNRSNYHFGKYDVELCHNTAKTEKEGFLEILETLRDLVQDGKIRHVGLSNETAWGTMQYLQLSEKHNLPRMASIQNEYSLLCRLFEPELHEVALMEDIGLLAWSPLATGILSGKYLNGNLPGGSRRMVSESPSHRENEQTDNAVHAYLNVAKKHGLDPCQMALAFVRQQDFVTSVIIGATTMEQLKSNIDSKDLMLDNPVLQEIDTVYRQYPNTFWASQKFP